MFDSLKAMGTLAGLMKNKDAIRAAGERIRARLRDMTAAGSAGGGAVRVDVSGSMEVVRVHIEPPLVVAMSRSDEDRVAAQRLIAEATNHALAQARVMAQRELAREAETMGLGDLPGLDGLLGP